MNRKSTLHLYPNLNMWFYFKLDTFFLCQEEELFLKTQWVFLSPLLKIVYLIFTSPATVYNSHRDSTVDRHLSTGSLELWEILLNLWNGRERQWLGNCVPVSLTLNDSAAIVERWTDTSWRSSLHLKFSDAPFNLSFPTNEIVSTVLFWENCDHFKSSWQRMRNITSAC